MNEDLTAIRTALSESGYYHAPGARPMAWFEAVCAELGEIRLRTDIHCNPEKDAEQRRTRAFGPDRPGVYTSTALAFHTDNPNWSVLGWYCVAQDEMTGESLLLDLGNIGNSFTAEELRELSGVLIYLPVRDASLNERAELVPILKPAGGAHDVYWAPWLVAEGFEQSHGVVLNRFREWLIEKEKNELISLRLQPGESLFIHNNRMLHGRLPLAAGSKRHLVRIAVAASNVREWRA